MAKFCGNCGAQLDDKAKVCGQCGMPLEGAAVKVPGVKITDPKKQKKTKKIIKGIAVAAALVIVAVIAINVISQYTGYKGLLRKTMNAYKNYDIDTLVSLSSDMYFYGDEEWVDNYFKYNVGENLDSFETSVGHSYKLSYEVNETYVLSERKADEILQNIESAYSDFDISIIEKMVAADVTVTAKQGKKSVDRDIKIIMSKENGSWKLLYIE